MALLSFTSTSTHHVHVFNFPQTWSTKRIPTNSGRLYSTVSTTKAAAHLSEAFHPRYITVQRRSHGWREVTNAVSELFTCAPQLGLRLVRSPSCLRWRQEERCWWGCQVQIPCESAPSWRETDGHWTRLLDLTHRYISGRSDCCRTVVTQNFYFPTSFTEGLERCWSVVFLLGLLLTGRFFYQLANLNYRFIAVVGDFSLRVPPGGRFNDFKTTAISSFTTGETAEVDSSRQRQLCIWSVLPITSAGPLCNWSCGFKDQIPTWNMRLKCLLPSKPVQLDGPLN